MPIGSSNVFGFFFLFFYVFHHHHYHHHHHHLLLHHLLLLLLPSSFFSLSESSQPFSTKWAGPSAVAVVRMPKTLVPLSGSEMPKACRRRRLAARSGKYSCLSISDPDLASDAIMYLRRARAINTAARKRSSWPGRTSAHAQPQRCSQSRGTPAERCTPLPASPRPRRTLAAPACPNIWRWPRRRWWRKAVVEKRYEFHDDNMSTLKEPLFLGKCSKK